MIAFEVKDMTCGHCVSTITKAVKAVDDNANVRVDLGSHRVYIEPTNASAGELSSAIMESGYTPVPADEAPNEGGVTRKRGGCCCG